MLFGVSFHFLFDTPRALHCRLVTEPNRYNRELKTTGVGVRMKVVAKELELVKDLLLWMGYKGVNE